MFADCWEWLEWPEIAQRIIERDYFDPLAAGGVREPGGGLEPPVRAQHPRGATAHQRPPLRPGVLLGQVLRQTFNQMPTITTLNCLLDEFKHLSAVIIKLQLLIFNHDFKARFCFGGC